MENQLAKDWFAEAQALYADGDYAAALDRLNSVERTHPDHANIMHARARCQAKLGELDAAIALCRRCVEMHDAPRVQRLLERLEQNRDAGAQTEIGEIPDLDLELPSAFDAPVPVKAEFQLPVLRILAGVAAVAIVAIALVVVRQWDARPTGTGALDPEELKARRLDRAADLQQRAEAPTETAGGIVPENVWRRTAIEGLPKWKPGVYKMVECPGTVFEAYAGEFLPRTIDVYIPMAYQERPDDLFPMVAISMPSMFDGFQGLENWAERNDAILVVINTSSNRKYALNWQAQDAALLTVSQTMRADPQLSMAIGMSGGAATSWEMICRYPSNFVGVVMMGMSGGHNDCRLPPHVRVAYIHGRSDHNNPGIKQMIPRLRRAGYQVREQIVPGAHVMGPVAVREQMLTWILEDARQEYGIGTV